MKIFGIEIKRVKEETQEEKQIEQVKTMSNFGVEDSLAYIRKRRQGRA